MDNNTNSEASVFAEEYFSGLYEGSKLNIESCKREIGRLEVKLREANVSLEYWTKVKEAHERHVSYFITQKEESASPILNRPSENGEKKYSGGEVTYLITRSPFCDIKKLADVFDIKEKITYRTAFEAPINTILTEFEWGPDVKLSDYFKKSYSDVLDLPARAASLYDIENESGNITCCALFIVAESNVEKSKVGHFLECIANGVISQRLIDDFGLRFKPLSSIYEQVKKEKEEAVVRK